MGASTAKEATDDVDPPLLRSRGRLSNREINVSNDVDPLVRSRGREIVVSKTNCFLSRNEFVARFTESLLFTTVTGDRL